MMARIALAIGLASLFLLLGFEIMAGWTAPFDRSMLAALRVAGEPGRADVPRPVLAAAVALTGVGTIAVRGPLAVAASVLLGWFGQTRAALALLAATIGETLLVEAIKAAVDRPRPPIPWALVHAKETSFPSGHAGGSMALFPLAGWLLGRLVGQRWATGGIALGLVLSLLIGLTRILLGVHWAADVVAGWLLGGVIALLAAGAPIQARRDGAA